MRMINQQNLAAEGFIQEDNIWERCAREIGITGEVFEEAREKRRAAATAASQPRLELIFEGLEGAGHVLGKIGDTSTYEYAGDAQHFHGWKMQTLTYVATMMYHRGEQDIKTAYRQAMRKVVNDLHGPALDVAKEMEMERLMKYIPKMTVLHMSKY